MADPLVTVLLPVRDGAAHLELALASLRGQTLKNFQVLILDNGSTDDTEVISRKWMEQDSRFSYAQLGPVGRAAALNEGMTRATGPYIARMDADDVCHERRLDQQVHYMNKHAEVDLCAGTVRVMQEGREPVLREAPAFDSQARAWLVSTAPFSHPSVMWRATVFRTKNLNYDPAFKVAEDYDLWERCAAAGLRFGFLPEPLLDYHIHSAQDTAVLSERQRAEERVIWRRVLGERLGMPEADSLLDIHERTFRLEAKGMEEVSQCGSWLEALCKANRGGCFVPEAALADVCGDIWWKLLGLNEENWAMRARSCVGRKFIWRGVENRRRLGMLTRMWVGRLRR